MAVSPHYFACHACEHRQRHCGGGCRCLVDDRPITEQVEDEYCPLDKFRLDDGEGNPLDGAVYEVRLKPIESTGCGCNRK